jgi:hypothetical protein
VDLALIPDVEARFALRGRSLRYVVLAPYGTWLGRGRLRVLRMRSLESAEGEAIELILGYDSYEAA